MKIGMIFECGPDGADQQVCITLASRLSPGIETSHVTLDNKPKLIRDCGEATKKLLVVDECLHVFIIWDLYPAWREKGVRPCLKEDRDAIFESLDGASVDSSKVTLVCIKEELEAWLIADHRALSAVLSTPAHPVWARKHKKPEEVCNPKKTLTSMFRSSRHKMYVDRWHAIQIVKALPDMGRLGRLPSFQRFSETLETIEEMTASAEL